MPIDVRIYMFLNKTPTNNFLLASFTLVQFLLIVLSVKGTYIRNGSQAWVAHSEGRALAGSRAHLVVESGPSICIVDKKRQTYKFCNNDILNHNIFSSTILVIKRFPPLYPIVHCKYQF